MSAAQAVTFGRFQFFPRRQLLLDRTAGAPGQPRLDILVVLVERAGEFVSKDELIALVWPDTFVEETNLGPRRPAATGAARRAGRQPLHHHRSRPRLSVRGVAGSRSPCRAAGAGTTERLAAPLPTPITRLVGRDAIVVGWSRSCSSAGSLPSSGRAASARPLLRWPSRASLRRPPTGRRRRSSTWRRSATPPCCRARSPRRWACRCQPTIWCRACSRI